MTAPEEIQQEVNSRIIDALERGIEPWRRPYSLAPCIGRPKNVLNGWLYTGINAILLDLHSIENGFRSCFYGTKADWRKVDSHVISEPGCKIIHGRSYLTVFNAEQAVDAEHYRVPCSRWVNIPNYSRAQRLIAATEADIRYGGDRCFYRPPTPWGSFPHHTKGDFIRLPEKQWFTYEQDFYYAALHELSHHSEPRLEWIGEYYLGELIAEIVACSLCRELAVPRRHGVRDDTGHAIYMRSWLELLREDARYVFDATEQASKTINYLLSFIGDDDRS